MFKRRTIVCFSKAIDLSWAIAKCFLLLAFTSVGQTWLCHRLIKQGRGSSDGPKTDWEEMVMIGVVNGFHREPDSWRNVFLAGHSVALSKMWNLLCVLWWVREDGENS